MVRQSKKQVRRSVSRRSVSRKLRKSNKSNKSQSKSRRVSRKSMMRKKRVMRGGEDKIIISDDKEKKVLGALNAYTSQYEKEEGEEDNTPIFSDSHALEISKNRLLQISKDDITQFMNTYNISNKTLSELYDVLFDKFKSE